MRWHARFSELIDTQASPPLMKKRAVNTARAVAETIEQRLLLSGAAGTPNLSSDLGLAGQTVYADLNNSGSYMLGDPVTTTDAQGNYILTGVSQGQAIIREVLQSGER